MVLTILNGKAPFGTLAFIKSLTDISDFVNKVIGR